MFKTATLYIFVITFNILLSFQYIKAQTVAEEGYYFNGMGPEDINLPIPLDSLVESTPLDHVIEGVGTIVRSSPPVYESPDKKSKVLRYAVPGEKMIITANDEDWFAVKMYNGTDGFIEKDNIKTSRVFYDESVIANHMDKSLKYELEALIDKFNKAMRPSIYVDKYKVVPKLTITSASKRNDTIIINMEFSGVDSNGVTIPSKQSNKLKKEMQKFIELMFMKMLPSKATSYKIAIKCPVFTDSGKVVNSQKEYAELELYYSDVTETDVKLPDVTLFNKIKSSVNKDELFAKFPN